MYIVYDCEYKLVFFFWEQLLHHIQQVIPLQFPEQLKQNKDKNCTEPYI